MKTCVKTIMLIALALGITLPSLAQGLWGKTTAGMTEKEVSALLPDVVASTDQEKILSGAVSRLMLPKVDMAGLSFSADFFFKEDNLRQVSLHIQDPAPFNESLKRFESLKKHLQGELNVTPKLESQRGFMNREVAVWVSGKQRVMLSLIGVLSSPLLLIHYYADDPMSSSDREIALKHSLSNYNPDKELEKWRGKAEKGNVEAQFEMGLLLFSSSRPTEGLRWINKAAEQNHLKAQTMLGAGYIQGIGVEKNPVEGARWLLKAAEQGDPQAQNALGFCYASGQGVTPDDAMALQWYRRAADQRDPQAQYNLGDCYRLGLGVAVDRKEALKWYQRAAAEKYPSALDKLQQLEGK